MRIAIVLSLLLVVALIGGLLLLPRLVAWDDYRQELTEQAEALTGQSVAIQGRIDLELLPRPTLTLAHATLTSRAGAPAERALSVDRLDLRLKPLPLLRGRFEVEEIRLVRPVLQIAEPEDASSAMLALAGGSIMLPLAADGPSRLSVVDGRAVLDGADATPGQEIEAINLDLAATGANGPYALSGEFVLAAQPFEFTARLGQTAPESWRTLQLEVTARASESPTSLSFRGLSWSDPGAPRLRGDLALGGSDARSGLLALDRMLGHRLPQLPDWLAAGFRLSGHLEFADLTAELDELHLALGDVEAEGKLRLTSGTEPAIDLQLDLPRVVAPDVVLPDGEVLAALAALAAKVRGQIDLSIGELAWHGGTIQRVRGTFALDGAGGMTVEQARATLPGQTRLGFTGALVGQGSAVALEGDLTLVASDLPSALAWLDLAPADSQSRLRTLSLASRLALSDGTLRFIDGDLRVDASRLTGSLALSLGARTQLAGAVTLDRLNLDAYWPDGEIRQLVERTLALFGRFDAALEARIDRLTWHGIRLQDLVLDGRSVAGRLTLNQLSLHDPAGNDGHLTGEFDLEGETYDLSAELDTTRPTQLLRGLGLEPPLMLARLTPLRVEGTLKGDLSTAEIDLEARHQDARLALAGTLDWSNGQPSYDLALDASHPDYPALLDQMGIRRTAGADRAAAFSMTGRLQGDLNAATTVVGSARLGSMSLTGRAGWQRGQPRPKLTLQISAGEPSAAALADLAALAGLQVEPGLFERPRPGAWSTQPLELRWFSTLDAELELSGKGGVVGPGFELKARLEQGQLTIDKLSATLWGGQVELQSSFDAWRTLPFMALALDLRGIDPTALAAWLDLPPVVEGSADLYAEATAAGDNPRALIGSLIGEVRIAVRDGRLVGGERLAELRAIEALDGTERGGALDHPGGKLAGAPGTSTSAADGAPGMALDDLGGSFALKRGIATTAGVPFELENVPARLEGTIDLLLWATDLKLEVGDLDGTTHGAVGLRLVGPLDRPQIRLLRPEPSVPLFGP